MERYARNDTHYLKPLADHLKGELQAKQRLDWHRESCARLIADSAQPRSADLDTIWRLRGSHLLGRLALAVLREIWQWREIEAVAANKPPFFVLSHDALIAIAAAAAGGRPVHALVPKHVSERRRCGLAKAIALALGIPAEDHPKILRAVGRKPNEAQRRRFLELQQHRDARAIELAIDPTLIASRSTLSDLAHNWEAHSPDLMHWQKQLLCGASEPIQTRSPSGTPSQGSLV
jgi:ribonuclease D